jgi:hypothetical protein
MSKRINFYCLAALVFSLPGCVAAWGDSKKVTRADESAFIIQYDNALYSSAGAKMMADQHCAKYARSAQIQDVGMPGMLVGIIQETYACVPGS